MRDYYKEQFEEDKWDEPPRRGRHFQEPEENQAVDPPRRKHRKVSEYLLSIIQILTCVTVLLVAVLLKSFGGQAYTAVRDWYVTHINQSILTQESLEHMKDNVIALFPPASASSSEAPSQESDASSGGEQSAAPPSDPVSSQESGQ